MFRIVEQQGRSSPPPRHGVDHPGRDLSVAEKTPDEVGHSSSPTGQFLRSLDTDACGFFSGKIKPLRLCHAPDGGSAPNLPDAETFSRFSCRCRVLPLCDGFQNLFDADEESPRRLPAFACPFGRSVGSVLPLRTMTLLSGGSFTCRYRISLFCRVARDAGQTGRSEFRYEPERCSMIHLDRSGDPRVRKDNRDVSTYGSKKRSVPDGRMGS
jgi:hypothetical protein